MYDATIGRWTSQEPLGLLPDSNPYRYVENRPVNETDPSGLEPVTPFKDPYTGESRGAGSAFTWNPLTRQWEGADDSTKQALGRVEPRYFGSTTQLLHAWRQITDPNGRTRTFLLHPKTGDWYEWPESFPQLPNYALLPWPAPLATEGIRRELRTPQDLRDFFAGITRGFVKQNVEDVLSIPQRVWTALMALPGLAKRGYDVFAAILNNDKDKLD